MKTINTNNWQEFRIGDLFNVLKGARLVSTDRIPGETPYVGATRFNNGITGYIGNDEKLHDGNVLTVCYNGPVGTTFYQPVPFWGTDDVSVFYPKFPMNPEIGLFIAPIIEVVGSRYAYIDKWKLVDMVDTELLLPVAPDGEPDWAFMKSTMKKRIEAANSSLNVLQKLRL